MQPFSLIHRRGSAAFAHLATSVPVWQTCLRQIAFIGAEAPGHPLEAHDTLFEGEQALVFLTGVLCGLESPVVGETEVMGQFRNFLAAHAGSRHPLLDPGSPWHQYLLSEVKWFRSEHICRLGSKSYGSLIRKELKDLEKVAVLGSGHFVGEILPWLKDKACLELWCRNPAKGRALAEGLPQAEVFGLEDPGPGQRCQALVVAAPLHDDEILPMLGPQVELVLDCRGEAQLFPENLLGGHGARVLGLAQLTEVLAAEAEERSGRVQEIRALISERARAHLDKPRFRPQGWEDLCA